jgi:hypothetical protein
VFLGRILQDQRTGFNVPEIFTTRQNGVLVDNRPERGGYDRPPWF